MEFLTRVRDFLLAWGSPGLFLVSFLDSAGIPMVGGPDAVVMLLSWQHPERLALIVAMAALGSTAGCVVLYRIGKRGGELALTRFARDTREKVRGKLERNDVLAVFLGVVAPPPAPTKVFIIGAGVIAMPLGRFVSAVLVGRLLRYLLVGYLGARFGAEAAEVLKGQYPWIALGLAILAVLYVVGQRVRRRAAAD